MQKLLMENQNIAFFFPFVQVEFYLLATLTLMFNLHKRAATFCWSIIGLISLQNKFSFLLWQKKSWWLELNLWDKMERHRKVSISICSEDCYYVSTFTYPYFIIWKWLCLKGTIEFKKKYQYQRLPSIYLKRPIHFY